MIEQLIIARDSGNNYNGERGFLEYTTKYENFCFFVDRVTKKANELKNVISISYPNTEVAIIVYKDI